MIQKKGGIQKDISNLNLSISKSKKPELLFSIIIPTFNRVKLLKRALDSIITQTISNWEIIIVDNYSNDGTKELIDTYAKYNIKYYLLNNENIIAKSRNFGCKIARGQFVAFLDSDDWWDRNKLFHIQKNYKIKPNIDLIYHNCFLVTSKKIIKKSNCRELRFNTFRDLVINGNTLITSSVVIKRQVLIDVNYFNEDKKYCGWEDYDLWVKIAKAKYKFFFNRKYLGFYWNGDDNFDTPKQILENLILIDKAILQPYKKNNYNLNAWWPNYTKGIALLKLNNNLEAKVSFFKVIHLDSPLIYKLKSLYYIFLVIGFKKKL